jgi:hypothetical protein
MKLRWGAEEGFRPEEWVKSCKEIHHEERKDGYNTNATVAAESSGFAGRAIAAFRSVFLVCRKTNGASAGTL